MAQHIPKKIKTGFSDFDVTADHKALVMSLVAIFLEESIKTAFVYAFHHNVLGDDKLEMEKSMKYQILNPHGCCAKLKEHMEEAVTTAFIEDIDRKPLAKRAVQVYLGQMRQRMLENPDLTTNDHVALMSADVVNNFLNNNDVLAQCLGLDPAMLHGEDDDDDDDGNEVDNDERNEVDEEENEVDEEENDVDNEENEDEDGNEVDKKNEPIHLEVELENHEEKQNDNFHEDDDEKDCDCDCNLCEAVDEIDVYWKSWTPQDELEKLLHKSIEKSSHDDEKE